MSLKTFVQNSYANKNVLVTGHTGFKGSWLTMFLKSLGANVTGIALAPETQNDHFVASNCELDIKNHIIGDITTSGLMDQLLQETKPDVVFHLAAQPLVRKSYENPVETYNTNVMGSLYVLEAIRKCPTVKSLVYVTSDKCYKNNEWVWGYRETDSLGGHDPYSASKALAELMFSSHWDSFFKSRSNFGAAAARAGNVIGGGDFATNRIVPDCVRASVQKTATPLRNPNSTRPWQHVLDPVFGYMLLGAKLLDSPKEFSGAWNFGPDSSSIKTVQNLVEKFISIWPSTSILDESHGKHPHEAGLLHLNCDKARHYLNWHPVWDFDKTLEKTLEWYMAWNDKNDMRKTSLKQIEQFWEQVK